MTHYQDPQIGSILAKDGKFYATRADAEKAGAKPMCVVIYISPKDNDGNRKAVEKGLPYHGLAMGLEDAEIGENLWFTSNKELYCTDTLASINFSKVKNQLNGWTLTNQYKNHCDKGHNHPFVEVLEPYTEKFDIKHGVYTYVSDWMIPSAGQMLLAFRSMGLKMENEEEDGQYGSDMVTKDGKEDCYSVIKTFLGENAKAFKNADDYDTYPYWLVTEAEKTQAWVFEFQPDGQLSFKTYDKNTTVYPSVRPFVLFGNEGK